MFIFLYVLLGINFDYKALFTSLCCKTGLSMRLFSQFCDVCAGYPCAVLCQIKEWPSITESECTHTAHIHQHTHTHTCVHTYMRTQSKSKTKLMAAVTQLLPPSILTLGCLTQLRYSSLVLQILLG